MRVTQGILSNNMLRYINKSFERMEKYQNQLATGKKISRPSDDPVVAMKGIEYRSNLTQIEQYKRNLSEAYTWMESSDSALDKATQALQRIRELVVQASNDTYEISQRQSIANEIRELKDHLASIANTKIGDKYIFNGSDTTTPPVDLGGGIYPTNSDPVEIEVFSGVRMQVNIDPTNVFSSALFTDINNLEADLNGGSTGAVIGNYLNVIDGHIQNFVAERAELGARYNRVELVDQRVQTQEVVANRIIADNEDADLERVITDLKMQESVHRAALGVGARVMQPTLLDFLR
jgi:flagellar hook-associated protein 3 FlgL